MRILITGSRGQLGNELRRCLESGRSEIGPVPACYAGADVDYVDYGELDISDAAAVDAWFAERGPYDLVVNCAAVTNVDGCESDEEGAYRVNATGAENMARAAAACGGKVVHVSTDYVFPGTDPEPRREDDPVGPISAYGRTKLAGEQLVMAACPRTFVVRTAWLYGYVGKNFVKTMLRLAREHGRISVVADQLGNPTSANDLAHEILASPRPRATASTTARTTARAAGSTSRAQSWRPRASPARRSRSRAPSTRSASRTRPTGRPTRAWTTRTCAPPSATTCAPGARRWPPTWTT